METVKGYITKHTPNPRPSTTVPQRTSSQPKDYHKVEISSPPSKTKANIQTTQERSLPPNFSSLESWHRYVKKIICIYDFLDNTELKSGAKFAGTIKNECYFCRLNNHTHQSCEPLQEYKRLALAAKENTDDRTSSTRDNLAKEDQQDTIDLDTNHISNINVTNYVNSTLNTIGTNSNSVLSCKPTKLYFTSHKSN